MKRTLLLIHTLLICITTAIAAPKPRDIAVSTRLEIGKGEPILAYEIKNKVQAPVEVDEIGVGSSPIYTRIPRGDSSPSSLIVDWITPPPPLAPGAMFSRRVEVSKQVGCAVGLYVKWMKVQGSETEKVALYRELELPCIDSRFNEDVDSIRVVTDLVKQGRFKINQRQRRQEQLDAFEGMKQYVMVNPYILALSVDGKPGFRLKLMATNNTQRALVLPRPNTTKNRIEIVGPSKDRVRSYPNYTVPEDSTRNLELKVGETQSWTEDIGGYIKEKGIRLPGRYTIRWIVDEKEVADFVFYLPEPEEAKEKAK